VLLLLCPNLRGSDKEFRFKLNNMECMHNPAAVVERWQDLLNGAECFTTESTRACRLLTTFNIGGVKTGGTPYICGHKRRVLAYLG
jgi:hypothetical protein